MREISFNATPLKKSLIKTAFSCIVNGYTIIPSSTIFVVGPPSETNYLKDAKVRPLKQSDEELKRVRSAGQIKSAGQDAFVTLLKERCKTLKYMAPSLEESFAKAYAQFLVTSATWGFVMPMSKDILNKLEGYAESLVEGIDIAVYPKPQLATEEEVVGKAALELLGHILRNKEFREKVAQTGKLTFMLSLDLSKINESAEVKSQILFWALVYEGLHKEGKI